MKRNLKESKKVISRKTLKEWWGKEKMSKEEKERIEYIFRDILNCINEPVDDNEILNFEVEDKRLTRGFDVCLSISSGKQPFGNAVDKLLDKAVDEFEKDYGKPLYDEETQDDSDRWQDFTDYMYDWYQSGYGFSWTITFDLIDKEDGYWLTAYFTDGWNRKFWNKEAITIKDTDTEEEIDKKVDDFYYNLDFTTTNSGEVIKKESKKLPKSKRVVKESYPNRHFHNSFTDYSEDFTDYYVVNEDTDKTAYSLGIWMGSGYYVDRFLCFADDIEDAINETLDYMWENKEKEKFVIYDYSEVKKMAEDNLEDYDEKWNEMKEEYDKLEEEYEELMDNKGKAVDNWSHFRELEKRREDLEYEMDAYKEEFVDKEIDEMWESGGQYSLFVYRENFRIDETPKDIAEEILRQVNEEENLKED
jgi:hypothetical protein